MNFWVNSVNERQNTHFHTHKSVCKTSILVSLVGLTYILVVWGFFFGGGGGMEGGLSVCFFDVVLVVVVVVVFLIKPSG